MGKMFMGLVGKKLGMTSYITPSGVIPVTVVQAIKGTVADKRTVEKDGYEAVRVAFQECSERKLNRPELGLFKKASIKPHKKIVEFQNNSLNVGDTIDISMFSVGDNINVTGITRGFGTSGTIKRWKFQRGPMSHGSKNIRKIGSTGVGTGMSKIIKGKKMPGHMGNVKRTVKNISVVDLMPEDYLVILKGSIPGHKNSFVILYKGGNA
ncbi:LSU ribosomal protein L3P [Thermodesulfobium acidiphilum]|uniref:50S ribosomal protein L3 n=1 Tax=Thermodesulfobium acidiphilum TaxID=1794699 RepID=A0A2R4VZF3_THEAF|nr:50S ribosomal protein L3 [Thermodesulfobium acidiphilum]AWB09856.1 LSU ribosomal protein L3P [Thermodesulfobium acidiphilum]